MLEGLLHAKRPTAPLWCGPELADPLARAAGNIARLDQALAGHPLAKALLYRARLEAVRRQAATDGKLIDPWHLAAVLEGLRLRLDGAPRIIDRGEILAAARHAYELHQWLTAPEFDQEVEVKQAESALRAGAGQGGTPLLDAGRFLHSWLQQDGARPSARAALVRYWRQEKLLCLPIPLTGAAALRPGVPWQLNIWLAHFLEALAEEAADFLQLLVELERSWVSARAAVAGRRKNSRAAAAVDALAAVPLVSASTLAAGLDMAVKNATALLEEFCGLGIAVEVTHRTKRRLFGFAGMAPLHEGIAPPKRPEPGRGRGRPKLCAHPEEMSEQPVPILLPLGKFERQQFDYGDLERFMAEADRAIRSSRRVLQVLAPARPERASDRGST